MSQLDLLKRVVNALVEEGVGYMVTGSLVSSIQGEPRSTHDIDIVVAISPQQAVRLPARFPEPDYFLDAYSVEVRVRSGSMFNLHDNRTGDKVDFWPLAPDPFYLNQFHRRVKHDFDGFGVFVSRPEDTIVSKLKWCKLGGRSGRQFRDALRVFEVQHATLDLGYIEHWTSELNVHDLWLRIKQEATPE